MPQAHHIRPPLGYSEEEYQTLSIEDRKHLWRRRFNLPDDEPVPDSVATHLHWDPLKMTFTMGDLEKANEVVVRLGGEPADLTLHPITYPEQFDEVKHFQARRLTLAISAYKVGLHYKIVVGAAAAAETDQWSRKKGELIAQGRRDHDGPVVTGKYEQTIPFHMLINKHGHTDWNQVLELLATIATKEQCRPTQRDFSRVAGAIHDAYLDTKGPPVFSKAKP